MNLKLVLNTDKINKMPNYKKLIESHLLNVDLYKNITNSISSNIEGRICNHRVSILYTLVEIFDIKNYLEIGVHNGTSMSYVVSSNKSINCIGVDLFQNTIERYNHDNLQYERTKHNILKSNKNSKITLIKGNSFHTSTLDEVKTQLNNNQLDILFIDGDHSYNGIKNDFTNYSPLVKKGGFIVMDDYNPHYPGIIKFCDNLSSLEYKRIGVFNNSELILEKII